MKTLQQQQMDIPMDPAMMGTFGGVGATPSEGEQVLIGQRIDEDLERFNTLEKLKSHLIDVIGSEKLEKATPLIYKYSDDLLYEKNQEDVYKGFEGVLTEAEIKKNMHFIVALSQFEIKGQKDKEEKAKKEAEQKKLEEER